MENKDIIFENVTSFKKRKVNKQLKNFNAVIDHGKVNSFVTEKVEVKKTIANLIIGKHIQKFGFIKNLNFFEKNFISTDSLRNISNRSINVKYYLEESNTSLFFKKMQIKKELIDVNKKIKNLKNELNLIDKSEKTKITYINNSRNKIYDEWAINNNSSLKKYVFNKEKIDFIDNEITNFKNEIKLNNTQAKKTNSFYQSEFKRKEKAIIQNINDNIKKFNFYKKNEIAELKNKNNDEIDSVEINSKLKKISLEIINHINDIEIPGFKIDKKTQELFLKIKKDKKNKTTYYDTDILLNLLNDLKENLNYELSSEIKIFSNLLFEIKDKNSAYNTKNFQKSLKEIQGYNDNKLNYYDSVINDINLKLVQIYNNDINEHETKNRIIWEFEKVSLRYQKQIYTEKIVAIKQLISIVENSAKQHTKTNVRDFYKSVKFYFHNLLIIDISFNSWRKKNLIRKAELQRSIFIEETNQKIINRQIKSQDIKRKILTTDEFKDILKSFTQFYKNKLYYEFSDDDLQGIFKKYESILIKNKRNINEKINNLENRKNDLLKNIDSYNREEIELKTAYLLEDVKFGLDMLDANLNKLSDSQLQKIMIVKSILQVKNLILIEEPKIDLGTNSTSSITNVIKKISEKYEITFVILTNDIILASETSDKLNIVSNGTNVEYGNSKRILTKPLHSHTIKMIENNEKIKFVSDEEAINLFEVKNNVNNSFTNISIKTIDDAHFVLASKIEQDKWMETKDENNRLLYKK